MEIRRTLRCGVSWEEELSMVGAKSGESWIYGEWGMQVETVSWKMFANL